MKENLIMIKEKEKVYIFGKMVQNGKEFLQIIL
jgi:hypothetical protein